MDKKCSVWFCDKKYYAKGYCVTHYRAVKRFGNPFGKHRVEIEKMQAKIDELKLYLAIVSSLIDIINSNGGVFYNAPVPGWRPNPT